MAFVDARRIERGALKMPVHVTRENEVSVLESLGPASQNVEAFVRGHLAIEIQAMPIESPGAARHALEGCWRGDLMKLNSGEPERRIFPP
jgi:hypothetical protein